MGIAMERTNISAFFGSMILIVLLSSCDGTQTSTKDKKLIPNFIIIYTDDQQYNGAGFNGNSIIKTPNLDKLASQSKVFTNAHVVFSLCSPSRAALLTGRYGIANGVLGLGSKLNKGEYSLAYYLKQKGYRTAHFGKWHLGQSPDELGFETYNYFKGNGTYYGRKFITANDTIFPEIHCDEYATEKAIEFLEEMFQNAEQPFFLFHCTQTPHMNGKLVWDAKPATKALYNTENMPVPVNHLDDLQGKPTYLRKVRNRTQAKKYGYPDSLAIQSHTRDYYAVISEMDGFLGKLFDKINALGLNEDTFVVFMSDNGWMLGDHGFTSKVLPYRTSTHVPLWIKGPNISSGHNNSIVTNLDIFPTILSLANQQIPENIHGLNLLPLIQGKKDWPRKYLVYEGLGTYGGGKHNISIISPSMRFIETYTDNTLETVTFQELYNMQRDSLELENLVDSANYKDIVLEMQDKISNFKSTIIKEYSK